MTNAAVPQHIAIIMDGNGRWAKQHALGRISGHQKGAEAVRTTVRTCRRLGVPYLTLYAFSVENWSRPAQEVKALMKLLASYIRSELQELCETGIRLNVIGRVEDLAEPARGLLREAMAATQNNRDMVLNLALSYGGRDEILRALKRIAAEVRDGRLTPESLSPEIISAHLDTADMPDPDLLIRTSGEYRISNFLLWQSAYTEFHFTAVLWPDFGEKDLMAAIDDYRQRERRFGKTSEQMVPRKDAS